MAATSKNVLRYRYEEAYESNSNPNNYRHFIL